MKKWLGYFFAAFFILCSLFISGIIIFLVECYSRSTELMYKGELEGLQIRIEKDLGNATMASYMTVYIDDMKVYDEKCSPRDTLENIILLKKTGVLKIFLREKTKYETYRDTITIVTRGQ
jgi:hypothetical protein